MVVVVWCSLVQPPTSWRRGPEAASLAIAVGRCWAASGVFVVLADRCFENPMIHTAANLPNDGGLADVLFLETSLQDVVHPGGRHLFHVVTAGANSAGPLGEIGSQLLDSTDRGDPP